MDFPLFYLDIIGNRLLMAIVAITHVIVNHPMAVGAWPLITVMEWWALRRSDLALDELVRKVTFVLFIVTTTVGALTGVGIWLTAALISPFGIGALLRIFFWAWFFEWLVFVAEVVLVLVYYLTWKRWRQGSNKRLHVGVGVALSVFSAITMIIIVAILGFMMGTGSWTVDQSILSAIWNPLYLPQLAFRFTFALFTAGLFVWFLLFFFTKGTPELKNRAVRFVACWSLLFSLPCALSGFWYWLRVPDAARANLGVGLMTQQFSNWQDTFLLIIGLAVAVVLAISLVGALRPRYIPRLLLIIPFLLSAYMLAHFERVREFIRKPHIVADYMYSNGVIIDELPVYQRDGILTYATFVKHRRITEDNKVEAGEDVYMIACSRCHTTSGVNSVLTKFRNLYGDDPWDNQALETYISNIEGARPFMPPFPGNDRELEALVAFIQNLRTSPRPVFGAQSVGIAVADSL